LSLTLASGASAATTGPALDAPIRDAGVTQEFAFREEEISDASLATFSIFDKEGTGAFRPGLELARRCVNCVSSQPHPPPRTHRHTPKRQ
jgi:hypothetical protein